MPLDAFCSTHRRNHVRAAHKEIVMPTTCVAMRLGPMAGPPALNPHPMNQPKPTNTNRNHKTNSIHYHSFLLFSWFALLELIGSSRLLFFAEHWRELPPITPQKRREGQSINSTNAAKLSAALSFFISPIRKREMKRKRRAAVEQPPFNQLKNSSTTQLISRLIPFLLD